LHLFMTAYNHNHPHHEMLFSNVLVYHYYMYKETTKMAKTNRGKVVKKQENWRGTCPICKRTGVKLLWTKVMEDGSKPKVCKICGNQK